MKLPLVYCYNFVINELVEALKERVGRFILNSVPTTGVEVCPSMHHGGVSAIKPWVRPVAYQNGHWNYYQML